jgi:hypothetical protein
VNCLASASLNSSVIIWPCYAFLLFTGAECWFRLAALMLEVEDMDSEIPADIRQRDAETTHPQCHHP